MSHSSTLTGRDADTTEVVAGVVVAKMPINAEGNPICGALKKDSNPCLQAAGAGTDHPGFGTCKWHAGAMPSSKVGAARQEIIQYVEKVKALGHYGPDTPPDEVMMQEVARSKASVEWLDQRLKDLTSDDQGDPLEGQEAIAVASGSVFNKIMYQWTEQRRLLQQISSMVVRAGIAKRQVEIHEMQAAAVLTAVLAVVGSPELGLQPQQVDFAKRMIANNLRDLATGPDQRAAMMEIASA